MAEINKESGLLEQVMEIRFPNKVTKGGRTLGVAALVAVGNGKGKVGVGYGKARAVPQAIEKAVKDARASMVDVYMVGDTVGQEVIGRQDAAHVLLKPASPGTGVKAGATVRAILEVLGVHNVLTKVRGNTNPINVAKATMNALRSIRSPEEVSRLRGVDVKIHHPQAGVAEEGVQAEGEKPQEAGAPEPTEQAKKAEGQ